MHVRVDPDTDHFIHPRCSPRGVGRVEAGEVFRAPASWWTPSRRNCEWLQPIDADRYDRLEAGFNALGSDYQAQRSALAALMDEPAPSGSDEVEAALREILYGD